MPYRRWRRPHGADPHRARRRGGAAPAGSAV